MATEKKSDVAPTKNDAQLPAGLDLSEIMNDAGAGVSNMGMDDVAVPYLYILQTNSPQTNPDHDMHVEGAKAGMFYNNVSGEVFDGRETGLIVIPCAYERKYVEWISRDNGGSGGYVADHDIDSGVINETKPDDRGRPILANGHMIVETAYHYVYFLNPNSNQWEEIIIPMKSTFLKKSRRWNKALVSTVIPGTGTQAPRWLYPYRLKTVKEQKADNVWSNFEIERLESPVTAEQYRKAKAFAALFEQGAVIRAKETAVGEVDEGEGKTIDGTVNRKMDEEIPF